MSGCDAFDPAGKWLSKNREFLTTVNGRAPHLLDVS